MKYSYCGILLVRFPFAVVFAFAGLLALAVSFPLWLLKRSGGCLRD